MHPVVVFDYPAWIRITSPYAGRRRKGMGVLVGSLWDQETATHASSYIHGISAMVQGMSVSGVGSDYNDYNYACQLSINCKFRAYSKT